MLFRLSRVSFSLTTAVEEVDAAASFEAFHVPTVAAAPQMPHMHGHVLVVEDNGVQPAVTARMLRRWGCRVTPASGMLDATRMLGETQLNTLTGPSWPGDTQGLRELGFDDHVCKPIRRNEMLAVLSQHPRPRAPEGEHKSGAPPRDAAQTPATAETPFALDAAALARLSELDPKGENQLLTRVLRAFQTSVARLRPQVEAARRSGDQAGLRLVAHTLKSSSASIGAMHLSQLCAQIETTIRTASGDDLEAQLDAFNAALDATLRAIERLLEERAP